MKKKYISLLLGVLWVFFSIIFFYFVSIFRQNVKVAPQSCEKYCAEFNITLDGKRKTEHIAFTESDLPLEIGPNLARKEKSETVFLKIMNASNDKIIVETYNNNWNTREIDFFKDYSFPICHNSGTINFRFDMFKEDVLPIEPQ